MKKLVLFFCCILSYSAYSQHVEEVKNGKFEKWTDALHTRPYPKNWGTSLEDDPFVKSILKIDTPHNGNHAIRLINVITDDGRRFFGDLHMGIYTGNPQTNVYVDYPYDKKIDVLKAFAKPRYIRNDSASIYMSFLTRDTIVTDTIYTFSADTSQWMELEFKMPELDTVPNKMLMLIANANLNDLGSSSLESNMDLDDIQFVDADGNDLEILNNGFEEWVGEDITYHLPNYWWTANKLGLEKLGVKEAPVQRVEDADEGDFAIKLITQKENRASIAYGNVEVLTNGAVRYSTIPYTGMPRYIKGSYNYKEPENGDGSAAFIFYQFRKRGAVIDQYLIPFTPDSTDDFKEFSQSILLNQEPDSMMIVVQSGDSVGSTLILDNLYFEGDPMNDGNINFLSQDIFQIAPNPFNEGDLNVVYDSDDFKTYAFEIMDISGKTIFKQNLKGFKGLNSTRVSLPNNLVSGFYLCTLKSGEFVKNTKLIIKK